MEVITRIGLVALGGALGSVSRYLLSASIPAWLGRIFLWGTFSVNVIGSFLIGIAWAYFESHDSLTHFRLFIIVGILGGFTTFSSFSLESITLLKDGHTNLAILYILMTNVVAIISAYGAYAIFKNIFST